MNDAFNELLTYKLYLYISYLVSQDEVAELAKTNFPELLVQYPDLGLDSYSVSVCFFHFKHGLKKLHQCVYSF